MEKPILVKRECKGIQTFSDVGVPIVYLLYLESYSDGTGQAVAPPEVLQPTQLEAATVLNRTLTEACLALDKGYGFGEYHFNEKKGINETSKY